VTQGGLGTLHEGLANVGNTESGLVGRNNVVVDDGGEAQGDVVLCHANLLWNLCSLNLDVDRDETLAERVDLDETRVDSLVETTELGDKTNITLLDVLVRVRADYATRNGTHGTNASTEGVDHGTIPALGVGLALHGGSIALLEVLLLGRHDIHLVLGDEAASALLRSLGADIAIGRS
jgi:hypothetical protein